MPQVKLKSRGGGGASPDSDAATPLQGVVPPFENGIFHLLLPSPFIIFGFAFDRMRFGIKKSGKPVFSALTFAYLCISSLKAGMPLYNFLCQIL